MLKKQRFVVALAKAMTPDWRGVSSEERKKARQFADALDGCDDDQHEAIARVLLARDPGRVPMVKSTKRLAIPNQDPAEVVATREDRSDRVGPKTLDRKLRQHVQRDPALRRLHKASVRCRRLGETG